MTIRGIYIHYTQGDGSELTTEGVGKKVLSQVKYLNRGGLSCSLQLVKRPHSVTKKALLRLPFFPDFKDWPNPDANLSFYYIRKPDPISRDFIAFLDSIKAANPEVKILLEIPSWPYDEELKNFCGYPKLLKDRHHRKKLFSRVDRIVNCAGEDNLFGVPALKMVNGIDFETILVREPAPLSCALHVLCVAQFWHWHGIDRFLSGLRNYYANSRQREIFLHLVGDGPITGDLEKMVRDFDLTEKVRFYGRCNQTEIDKVYDKCSFAVASLGLHRLNIEISSTLKTREYLAKGMPFVFSSVVDIFQEGVPDFCLQVPADESPIDVERLLLFHDALYGQEEQEALIRRVRGYAEKKVSMEISMKPMIDFIKENCTV